MMNPQIGRCLRLVLVLAAGAAFGPGNPLNAQTPKDAPKAQTPRDLGTYIGSPSATVFYLDQARAGDVAKTIEALYADAVKEAKLKVVADDRTNAVFISASDKVVKEISDLLKLLDSPQPRKSVNEVKVFTLKNASASDAMRVIRELVGQTTQMTADPRTNSLIATGKKDELETIEAILIKLDESQNQPSEALKVYPLKHISVHEAMDKLFTLGTRAHIAQDKDQNRLLVRGDDEDHNLIADLLTIIDVEKREAKRERMQLRIVWLVDEKLAGADAREPAKNLEKLVNMLKDKLGVTNLKMAAQLLVTVDPGQDFTAEGSTQLESGTIQLQAEGAIVDQTGTSPVIQFSIHATQQPTIPNRSRRAGQDTLTSLTTKVTAPAGHSIVIGTTPIQSADSVFVLQVLSNDDPPESK